MVATTIPDSIISPEFNISELTNGEIAGNGVFDIMMASVKTHLLFEFEAGRIRGTDYANMYSMAIVQVMEQSTRYAMAKAKLALELQLVEAQIGQVAADTVVATKQALLIETQAVTQGAQSTQIAAETRQTEYVTSFQIPSQIAATEAQTAVSNAQELGVKQETLSTIAQKDQILSQTLDVKESTKLKAIEFEIQTFNRDFKLAKELAIMEEDILIKESQVLLSNKEILIKQGQIDLATKYLVLKQSQIDMTAKDLLIKESQIGITEKELLIKTEQLAITKYELTSKLPSDVALTISQKELYTQKTVTELAQVSSTPIGVGSVIGINNHLLDEQAKVFLRQGQQTAAKLLIDTWNVRHTADPDGNFADETNKLSDANIAKAVNALMSGINIT
jgi:hypothetical protein